MPGHVVLTSRCSLVVLAGQSHQLGTKGHPQVASLLEWVKLFVCFLDKKKKTFFVI